MPLAASIGNLFSSEVIVILLLVLLGYVIVKLSKGLMRVAFVIIINSAFGISALFIANKLFDMKIPIVVATLASTAIFGLPATGTLVMLRAFGLPL